MDNSWSVYIVECADGTLYTGVARSVRARLLAHNLGRGAKYTRGRLPVRLVYLESGHPRSDAYRRERMIKKKPREKKLLMIRDAESVRGGLRLAPAGN